MLRSIGIQFWNNILIFLSIGWLFTYVCREKGPILLTANIDYGDDSSKLVALIVVIAPSIYHMCTVYPLSKLIIQCYIADHFKTSWLNLTTVIIFHGFVGLLDGFSTSRMLEEKILVQLEGPPASLSYLAFQC